MRLLWFVVLACLSLPSYSVVKVKIATDPWCPYVCEEQGRNPGMLVEIAEQAFAVTGYFIEFIWLNWARAIKEARVGNVQGIIGAYRSDSPDFLFGKEHLALSHMCFYTKPNDHWRYSGLSSLNSQSISLVNAYSYGDEFDNYVIKEQLSGRKNIFRAYGKETLKQRITLLNNNKVDVLVEDQLVINEVNRSLKQGSQLRHAGCLPSEKIYLAFSPDSNLSPRLSRALDQGIKILRENGRLQQIINKYN